MTPLIQLDDPAREDRTIGFESLTHRLQPELFETTEGGQVRAGEVRTSGSVRHVEVFPMGSVRTSILRRPRPLSGHRRADQHPDGDYTLIWEEPPYDAVIRELTEETGCEGIVTQLLGVDSRLIPAAERTQPGLPNHQNVGIFYSVRVTGGELRPEPNGDTTQSVWTPIVEVSRLRRSSLVDVGLALAETTPATGHVALVEVGGLVQH